MKTGESWTLVFLWACLIIAGWWVVGALFGVAYRAAMWVIEL